MIASNLTWVVAGAAAIYISGVGIESISPKQPTQASLKSLTFENGMFGQEFFITGDGFLTMKWSAEINRGNMQLCSGGGVAPYRDATPKQFSPDNWTFDDCPPLIPGDEAFAVWSYTDDTGLNVKFQGTLVLTEEHLAENRV